MLSYRWLDLCSLEKCWSHLRGRSLNWEDGSIGDDCWEACKTLSSLVVDVGGWAHCGMVPQLGCWLTAQRKQAQTVTDRKQYSPQPLPCRVSTLTSFYDKQWCGNVSKLNISLPVPVCFWSFDLGVYLSKRNPDEDTGLRKCCTYFSLKYEFLIPFSHKTIFVGSKFTQDTTLYSLRLLGKFPLVVFYNQTPAYGCWFVSNN